MWWWFATRGKGLCLLLASVSPLAAQTSARAKPAPDPETDLQQYLTTIRAASARRMELDQLYGSAREALKEGSYPEAEQDFRKLSRNEPTNSRGIEGLAEVSIAKGHPADAIEMLEAEHERQPRRLDLLYSLTRIAEEAGSPRSARLPCERRCGTRPQIRARMRTSW